MPQRRAANDNAPPAMTWGRALPVLLLCLVFDALRFMFEWFTVFGPIFIGLGVNFAAGNGTLANLAATAATAASAFFGFPLFAMFGFVMAFATGIFGWMCVVFFLKVSNPDIFKHPTAWLWSGLGFGLSEIPFVGSIPALTLTTARLYHAQIKVERAALEKWQKEHDEARTRERNERIAEVLQQRASQAASNNEEIHEGELEDA